MTWQPQTLRCFAQSLQLLQPLAARALRDRRSQLMQHPRIRRAQAGRCARAAASPVRMSVFKPA